MSAMIMIVTEDNQAGVATDYDNGDSNKSA